MTRGLALGASVAVILLAVLPVAPAPSTAVRAVAAIGDPAPGGGQFGGFTVESLPVLAPTNGRGQVAFFATIHRGPGGEGFFLRSRDRVTRIAREGDTVPGVGALSGFGRHPMPALNESGAVAFAAAVAGGKTVEGIFLSARGRLQPVALSGGPAPGVSSGTLSGLSVVAKVPLGSAYVNSHRPSFKTSIVAGAPATGGGGASGADLRHPPGTTSAASAPIQARRIRRRIDVILPGDRLRARFWLRQFTDTSEAPSRPQNVASLS